MISNDPEGSFLRLNHICYCRDKSVAGHSFTLKETIAVTPTEIHGATAYEVSGTNTQLLLVYSDSFMLKSFPGVLKLSCRTVCMYRILYHVLA